MLIVEFSQAAITEKGLLVGVVIRYGQDGPVRFAQLRINDEDLDWQTLDLLTRWGGRAFNRYLDREREILDEQEPRLF